MGLMANNFILAYPNRIDASGVVFSGGSWEADLPLVNLQDTYLSKVARSTNAVKANTKFDINLGTNRYVQIFALLMHNVSTTGKIRVRAWQEAGHTNLIYDSEWKDAWPMVYQPGQVEWENDNFWTLSWLPNTRYPIFHLLILNESAQYWEVEIDDEENTDGYIQAGRLVMGSVWQPLHNYSYGSGIVWKTNTLVDRTPGGVDDFDDRPSQRIQRLSIDHLTNEEAFGMLMDIQKEIDISGEVFFIADAEDTINLLRRSFLARPEKNNMIAQTYYDGNASALTLREVL